MFFRKNKIKKKITIYSIEGHARDLPGVKAPSHEEFEKAQRKFLEACKKRLGLN